jgi:hypothetical protein
MNARITAIVKQAAETMWAIQSNAKRVSRSVSQTSNQPLWIPNRDESSQSQLPNVTGTDCRNGSHQLV